jgi:hypothetical protein
LFIGSIRNGSHSASEKLRERQLAWKNWPHLSQPSQSSLSAHPANVRIGSFKMNKHILSFLFVNKKQRMNKYYCEGHHCRIQKG